jgi:glycine cleavage system H protein
MKYPENLKYTKDHEWTRIDGNQATIGITHHAQSALGDVVFVELPKVGRVLKSGETFGVVESIKAVSDLYSPCSGKVLEVNQALLDNPALANQDPHQNAWMIKLEVSDPSSVENLMSSDSYSQYVETIK